MTTLLAAEPVTVWTERGKPVRVVWRGQRFRVSDVPTPIHEAALHALITHPLERLVGCRFQGTNELGESHVFDVQIFSSGTWH